MNQHFDGHLSPAPLRYRKMSAVTRRTFASGRQGGVVAKKSTSVIAIAKQAVGMLGLLASGGDR